MFWIRVEGERENEESVMTAVLEVHDLVTKFYTLEGIVHAVNGVSFSVNKGEILAVVGESGSGKSVTMKSLLGLISSPPGRIESGKAIFNGPNKLGDLLEYSPQQLRDIRGGDIGYVFQDPGSTLNPIMTVGEQIAETILRHQVVSREEAYKKTLNLLEKVGIADPVSRYKNYPFQFSGGMRQRVMIAIAIACDPQMIIADEPTTALDVTIQAQIIDLFKKFQKELNIAVIWITHDLGVVAGIADRVLVMYGGRIMETAPVNKLYETPKHPYTIGLLGSLPRLNEDGYKRLVGIEGVPLDASKEINHCPFAARCDYAFERCWNEKPKLAEVDPEHKVSCFYRVEKGGSQYDR